MGMFDTIYIPKSLVLTCELFPAEKKVILKDKVELKLGKMFKKDEPHICTQTKSFTNSMDDYVLKEEQDFNFKYWALYLKKFELKELKKKNTLKFKKFPTISFPRYKQINIRYDRTKDVHQYVNCHFTYKSGKEYKFIEFCLKFTNNILEDITRKFDTN